MFTFYKNGDIIKVKRGIYTPFQKGKAYENYDLRQANDSA